MNFYPLLVNGKSIDTGIYDFYPNIEKVLTEFEKTRKIIEQLKSGNITKQADDFILGKYCLNNNETNLLAIESAKNAFVEFRNHQFC